jgi:hypothetical protein
VEAVAAVEAVAVLEAVAALEAVEAVRRCMVLHMLLSSASISRGSPNFSLSWWPVVVSHLLGIVADCGFSLLGAAPLVTCGATISMYSKPLSMAHSS